MELNKYSAWFNGFCKECGNPLVWSTENLGEGDYSVYCSNPNCRNNKAIDVGDMEEPEYMIDNQFFVQHTEI